MKTYIFILTLILCFVFQPGFADNPDDDPLADSRVIRRGGGNEIIGFGGGEIVISKYFPAMEVTPTDTILKVLTYPTGAWNTSALTTINVNDNDLSDIVAAWDYGDGIVKLVALRVNPNFLNIDTLASWEKEIQISRTDPVLFHGDWWISSHPMLSSGDFTGDGKDEFVLVYWAKDAQQNLFLYLVAYDVDNELIMTEMASVMDQPVAVLTDLVGFEAIFTIYDMTTGDFNGDGKDEILLVGREAGESGGWNLFASVYSYEPGSNTLARMLKDTLVTVTDNMSELINVKVINGYLNNGDRQQAIVYYSHLNKKPESYDGTIYMRPDTSYSYMVALAFDESLSSITQSAPYLQGIGSNQTYPTTYLVLNSADITGNGFEEIFSGYSIWGPNDDSFRIYQINGELEFVEYANLDSMYCYNVDFGNIILNITGEKRSPELILPGWPHSKLYTFDIDENGIYQGLTLEAEGNYYFPMVTTADLDGDIRLGTPKRSSITKILQPLIILNAPPIHFDIFDGINYDVSKMYNQNDPKFISSYRKETTQSKEVQTEYNKDWGISGTLSTSHSFFGVSVSSHLTTTYGEKFSKQEGSSTTVTVGINAYAIEDDCIYATVLDYNVWEYPVIGNGIERGHVLVVEPVAGENRWFNSKSWSGHAYVPEHEVGNILSYREYPLLSDNPAVAEKIKGDYNNSFVLHGNSSYDWSLQFDDFQSAGSTTQKEFGMDWGASIGGWGVKLEISGHYSSEQIRTQRTSVASGLFMGSTLRSLDMGLGEVSYRVTPYAYWAKIGALVIDYAVQPELAQPGGTPTWWQVHYSSKSDPSFILPWRYDPEKGFTLQDPAKRHQTKDITFFPESPNEGDLVTITARIHNFSLLPTPLPVGVSFYIGDPDNGGTLITGEGGVTKVHTSAAIPARGLRTVQMQWTVPPGIGSFPRIYGLIDPDQSINEIHDNNNKGWAILGKTDPVGVEEYVDHSIPVTFTLRQNYPNPFNPGTTIEFSIPKSGMVTLEVYNILGQKVATLVSEELFAGNHSYYWDAGRLASGMYIYRLQAGEFIESKKLVLLK